MDHRPPRHRTHGQKNGKSSFGAPLQDRQAVRQAIDGSLHTVRFNAQDMRTVLKAAKIGKKPSAAKKKRRVFRPDLIFSFTFALLIALPASFYAIRSRDDITTITTPGQPTIHPHQTAQGNADIIAAQEDMPAHLPAAANSTAVPGSAIDETEAIRIARECFEAQCDTTVFTFEEYVVAVHFDADSLQYTVTLDSMYKNGCRFTVVLSGEDGRILQHSAPRLAITPTALDSNSPEVRAWFEKHGEFMFTWPQDVQAEFSRRYQGATLRAAHDGEISAEEAIAAVSAPIESKAPDLFTAFYPVLYSERASSTGRAFYLVYCYPSADEAVIRDSTPMTVSFDAVTGDIISIENNPLEDEFTLNLIENTTPKETNMP